MFQILIWLLNDCFEWKIVPIEWRTAGICLILKKGDNKDIRNIDKNVYSVFYKILSKLITSGIEGALNFQQPTEQVGFRKRFSTLYHILSFKDVTRKCDEYNLCFCLLFIDYEKVFDSVSLVSIIKAIELLGVEQESIEMIKSIYRKITIIIKISKKERMIYIFKK